MWNNDISAKDLMHSIEQNLSVQFHCTIEDAIAQNLHMAIGHAVIELVTPALLQCEKACNNHKQACYLSAEYLMGRMVYSNLFNLGVLDDLNELFKMRGLSLQVLETIEDDAFGNGGLGRLAACFLDSAATLSLPLQGYGLRYKYGLFHQSIINGRQIEQPDDWSKYSCEELNFSAKEEGGDYWTALEAIARFNLAKSIKDYSEPVDKEEWEATPHTVNCFYYPQQNGIYILGAFARGGFYSSEMSDEELYGALGTAIGHEISHAFDSLGSQFDKDGNMSNWWTEEDYAKFLERNEKMVAYYNAMHPWEGQDFYGSTMTGEACADMAGIKVMLQLAADHPDFDYDKFFRTFANNWLTKDTLQRAYARINDVHPMCYLRINATLQQYDEFLDCYGIKEGDGMYLAPENRVTIW